MRCGIGDYTAHLAQALSQKPNTIVAVLTDVAAQPVAPQLGYETLLVARGWSVSAIASIIRATRGWQPDVVHMQFPTQGYGSEKLPWLVPPLFAMFGQLLVQTWHEYILVSNLAQFKNCLLYLPCALTPGGLVVVRPHFKDVMPRWYRSLIKHKQFKYIPNASAIPSVQISPADREIMRVQFPSESRKLVAYFGFAYSKKGLELLFEIADPADHHLILICELSETDPYQHSILALTQSPKWRGHVTVTGFLPEETVGKILAVADAAVFPFREGGGHWNTSLQGALAQGTFVLTTSHEQLGYDPARNLYAAKVDNVSEMRQALMTYLGQRRPVNMRQPQSTWDTIADEHLRLYATLVK